MILVIVVTHCHHFQGFFSILSVSLFHLFSIDAFARDEEDDADEDDTGLGRVVGVPAPGLAILDDTSCSVVSPEVDECLVELLVNETEYDEGLGLIARTSSRLTSAIVVEEGVLAWSRGSRISVNLEIILRRLLFSALEILPTS